MTRGLMAFSRERMLAIPLGFALLAGCASGPHVYSGALRSPPPVVDGITVPHGETEFLFRARPGGLLLVTFGFTSCPDVCPTTMADLRAALHMVADDAGPVDVAMVTIDPDRDTRERIEGYVATFFPDGNGFGLRTDDPDRLAAIARAFGAVYSVDTMDDGRVSVSHSAWVYAVDDQGRLVLSWPFGTPRPAIAADIEALLEGAPT